MKTDRRIGGSRSAPHYRHPLVFCITQFLQCIKDLPDPVSPRLVWWTPMRTALAAILMALDHGCSLRNRFEDARACLSIDLAGGKRAGGTYNGLLKALERQAATILPLLKSDLRRQAKHHLARLRKKTGWPLLAVDGSKVDLPRTRDQEKAFGIADNGVVPQALLTVLVEVRSGLLWDWRVDRGRGSETGHLVEMASSLPPRTLLLGDGNFVGYPIWSTLATQNASFLIRVGGNVHLLRRLWPDAEIQTDGQIVYAWPRQKQKEEALPLMLRLIKVGRSHNPVYLLTNILDSQVLSQEAAGAMYRHRWEAELYFRTLKRTLGYAKLQSRTGRRARIELEWAMIAMMIMTMMGLNAASKQRINPERLSPAHMIRTLRSSLLMSKGEKPVCERRALYCKLVSELKDTYKRHKSKRSRYHPITRNTPKPLVLKPPKIRTATPNERKLAMNLRKQSAA